MAHVNRRQWERFAYPAELQLTAAGHILPAKLVDLSQRGMQVIVPVKLYAGNAIRAELPTPRAALVVTGRVSWAAADRTDGTARTRAGIAFDALPPAAEQELRVMASERPGTSVIVQLPGSDEPVRASAIRTSQGVRVSFTLPFLQEGSIVTLQPSDAEAEVARVVHTHVYAGGTGAETRVELLVEPCTEARKRRFVQYDAVQTTEPEAASTAAVSDGIDSLTVPKRRVLAKLGYGLSLAAGLWLVVWLSQPGAAESPASGQAEAKTPAVGARAHADAEPQAARRAALSRARATTDARASIAAVPGPVSSVPPAQTATGMRQATEAKPATDTRPASETVAAKGADSSPVRAPQVSTTKDTTEIFVPVTGSLAGLETKIWTDPPAIAVAIPRGLVALKRRRYDIQAGGVVGLSVGRPGGVTQLRVYVNSILSQYEATAAPGGVTIRIKHDLQSPH